MVSSAVNAAPPIPRGALVSRRWGPAAGGLVVLAVAWPLFVFTGSQAAYLISIVAACCTAGALAAMESSLVVGYLVGLMALVGPEVNGQLGAGNAPLGSLRILDAATAAAGGAAFSVLVLRWVKRRGGAPRGRFRPGALSALAIAAVGYATLRWAMEGHRVDSFLRTDLRLVFLAVLFWFIASNCQRGGARTILWCVVIVGVLAALKAAAIHISAVYAIGSYDRLQATSYYGSGRLRTIVIGGDTLLTIAPAVALLLASVERRVALRVALVIGGLVCVWALGLSATRTSVLVSLGLIAVALAAILIVARPRVSRSVVGAGCALAVLVLVVALIGGAGSRLTQSDAPHVGLNFRKDEIKSFLNTPATTKYLGQGLAGRFMGKNVNGQPVLTGWAHELPVWIALKAGVFGLVCAILALGVLARRAAEALQGGIDRIAGQAGIVLVLGLMLMSMTLNRVALPEGIPPFMVGVLLISSAVWPPMRSSI